MAARLSVAIGALALVVLLCCGIAFASSSESHVTFSSGTVEGIIYPDARAFYSIPYAAPPTGSNRWMPPSPPASWSGVLNAQKYGPACPQLCDLPPFTCPIRGVSEDCLHLDVYTPRLDTITAPRPVMVFYYGGNYKQGGSSTPLYNGNFLANNTQVIVVVLNYRLGALSFFINRQVSGNLATQDQTMGLLWVQKNIAAFGGDPNSVTIYGQSAGGSSVACHMLSPPAQGLFHRAIMESNPIQLQLKTKRGMQTLSDRFAQELGCNVNDLNCLQAQNVSAILQAQNAAIGLNPLNLFQIFMPWQPYVDGKIITEQPITAFTKGTYNKVPFMLGNVEDEGTIFIYEAFPKPLNEKSFRELIFAVFKSVAPQVLAMYPIPQGSENDTRAVVSTIGTHYIWACPNRNISRYMSQNAPLYLYHFDHVFSFNPWGPNYTICTDYCCHGSELPYVFQSAPKGGYPWGPGELDLAVLVSSHWGNFATSGSPNTPVKVATQWNQFTQSNDQDVHYQTPSSSMETGYVKKYCDFWDSVGYEWGN